ncbi:DUF4126 family protein [Curtobacterium sp. NPDC090217]|uniref:DUF4126 family protein n=1 Tax=unclassified Curtobacterium TaxID=257496 RepID=UPI0007D7274F|nr:DUF4126 family protein [Curtobacterium sp. 9128]SBN61566.1 Uncharacterized membrane protein [Curtobacterium sp. 9128]
MAKNTKHTGTRALLLGILSGGRSATPLALLALNRDRKELTGAWQDWPMFRTQLGRGLLVAGAVGELVGDKLPKTPSRIAVAGLIGRAGSGALVGAAIATTGKRDRRVEGAVLGAVGALIGSFAGYFLRKAIGTTTGLRDPLVALGEDAAVIAGSSKVITAR